MIRTETVEETQKLAKELLGYGADNGSERFGTGLVVRAHGSNMVTARRLEETESGVTYNRNGDFENEWTAGPGHWVITACDENGDPLLSKDGTGKTNSWHISDEKFREKYDLDEEAALARQPVPKKGADKPAVFVRLDEDAELMQSWGQMQHMPKGSWLCVTSLGDTYGVDPDYFEESYAVDAAYGCAVDSVNSIWPGSESLGGPSPLDVSNHLQEQIASGELKDVTDAYRDAEGISFAKSVAVTETVASARDISFVASGDGSYNIGAVASVEHDTGVMFE